MNPSPSAPLRPFLVFIHVEKCGGITLSHLIQHNIPTYVALRSWYYWSNQPGSHFRADELKWLIRLAPFVRGIGGHRTRTYADYESVARQPLFYMTFIRQPIARYMSHLNYQRQVMGINWDIEEFVHDRRFDNYMVHRLAGSADLEKAQQAIHEKMGFVGLTERYDESLLILKSEHGELFKSVNYETFNRMQHLEGTLYFDDLSQELQARIVANNDLDQQLYDYVVETVYPGYLERYPGDIQADLAAFRQENEIYRFPPLGSGLRKLYRNGIRYGLQPVLHHFLKTKSIGIWEDHGQADTTS